jgi:hypothetical protein
MSEKTTLVAIVADSGLDRDRSDFMLTAFGDSEKIAHYWGEKAKTIVVTGPEQVTDMLLARTGRLFLRDKRIAIEHTRKAMKEQALREGKAIDGVAKFLTGLIEPIETYLDEQEHYVEIQAKKKAEADRIEAERLAAEEAAKQAEAALAEQVRIKAENDKLRAEAEKNRAKLVAEQEARAKVERDAAAAKAKAEAEKNRAAREAAQAKAKAEAEASLAKAKAEKVLADAKAKAIRVSVAAKAKTDEEHRRELAKLEEVRLAAEKKTKEEHDRFARELANMIECPNCHHRFQRSQ